MITNIIHKKERTDRIENISKLMASFSGSKIFDAVVPAWEKDPHAVAMRGCVMSHLGAVKKNIGNQPILVLEDDAVLIPENMEEFLKISPEKYPKNCAAILLGADVSHYGDDINGFRKVVPPYFGTHAVLYLPNNLDFLLAAMEIAATKKLGNVDGGICTESVLMIAAMNTGKSLYRYNKMCFTTLQDYSDSRGTITPPRDVDIIAKEKEPLMPLDTWAPIFEKWSGKKCVLLNIAGNPGDFIINAATRGLFKHYNIEEVQNIDDADVVFYPGGGNASAQYPHILDNRFPDIKKYKVILPQTLHQKTDYVESADEVWVRDEKSLEYTAKGKFSPDLSLAYKCPLTNLPPAKNEIGVFFRTDAEKTFIPKDNIGDPVNFCRDHLDYLILASSYKHIHTNRLHFAVAGLIMGAKVTLYDNVYHKNRSVFQTLQKFGVQFKEITEKKQN